MQVQKSVRREITPVGEKQTKAKMICDCETGRLSFEFCVKE